VVADRCQFVGALHRLPVQGLDVGQYVGHLNEARAHLSGRHCVEHVRIVGVRAMRADNLSSLGWNHVNVSFHYTMARF
jgi:hypothetical protein